MIRKALFLALTFILLLVPGCWNRREINSLSFVLGMGIEKLDSGNMKITVQVPKASELIPMAPVDQKPYWVISGEGRNLYEAVDNLKLRTPRTLYFAHNNFVIFDKALAEEGLKKYIDFLSRDFEIRQGIFVLIADGWTPEQILTFETEVEEVPALGLFRQLQSARGHTKSVVRTLREFIRDGTAEYRSTYCGVIKPVPTHEFPQGDLISPPPAGEPQVKYDLFIEGTALFLDKKLKTILDGPQTMGLKLGIGAVDNGLLVFDCPLAQGDFYTALEVLSNTSEIKASFVDNSPRITLKINLELMLTEQECPANLLEPGKLEQMEQAARDKVEKLVSDTLNETKKAGADVFTIGLALAVENRDWWRKNRQEWPKIYSELDVDYEIELEILASEVRARQRGN